MLFSLNDPGEIAQSVRSDTARWAAGVAEFVTSPLSFRRLLSSLLLLLFSLLSVYISTQLFFSAGHPPLDLDSHLWSELIDRPTDVSISSQDFAPAPIPILN